MNDTNPKDAVGTKKWRQYSSVPMTVIWELGVAMLEGARKYGRHNYRVAEVRASVYVDAAKGHIDQWWEGEDLDADSKLSHLTKAIASLVVIRDAMINDCWTDDRPPKANLDKVRTEMQAAVEDIMRRIPVSADPFTEINCAAPSIKSDLGKAGDCTIFRPESSAPLLYNDTWPLAAMYTPPPNKEEQSRELDG